MTRRELILKCIVEYFIKTAEPVGSKTLIEQYGLDCSSATIRNEMNALEKEGLLEKTHTSSGRVPSAAGYEYYVSHLREDRIDEKVKHALATVLEQRTRTVEEIIKQSCEILSSMTNLASVVLGPKVNEEHLVSVQVIPLSEKTATAVFVTDQGYVENKTFLLPEDIRVEDLVKGVATINDRLKGSPISEIVGKMEAMKPALEDYLVGQDMVYQALMNAFLHFASERMDLYGKGNLLDQPEFAEDAKKLRRILELLDDPKAFREAFQDEGSGSESVSLKINEDQDLGEMAMLSASFHVPGGQKATLSLLGPSRLDYDKAVAMLDYVCKTLDQYFEENELEENE